jgi:glycosyltransferase involved in cell wall biosynthesis
VRVAFVTNFCPHYRVRTFEVLASAVGARFLFFSRGDEWYWPAEHGVRRGDFPHEYLATPGRGRLATAWALARRLFGEPWDAYLTGLNGRWVVPLVYLAARLRRRPFVLWTGIWMRLGTRGQRLLFPATRFLYRHADAIVVYGEHVARYLAGEGVARERIFVAHHAIDNPPYAREVTRDELSDLRRRLDLSDTDRVVLYLGRLERAKGLEHLLRAFAGLDDARARLVLTGSGSDEAWLRAHARELGCADRVRWAGYAAPDRTVVHYALARVAVLPSVTTPSFKEPWGLVVNEAFNQGVPVIASASVGAAAGGLVEDGVTGLVVPEADPARLSQALSEILGDDALRDRLGAAARARVAGWDNERMAEGFRAALAAVGLRGEA